MKVTTKRAISIYLANFMLAAGVYTLGAEKNLMGFVFLVAGIPYRIIGEGYVGDSND